jgi:hypothetical protein
MINPSALSLAPPAETTSDPHSYPRPQLKRASWESLDGVWDFAFDLDGRWQSPADVRWDRSILVPFSPETPRSGIGDTGYFLACWYRRPLQVTALRPDRHLIVHFGAVDYQATVWVDGIFCGTHRGGYTPFSFDVTRFVRDGQVHELTLRAEDDPRELAKPRGKQDWQREPHSIWYPRTTGIWQTVWMEEVPATRLRKLRWTPNLERWELGFEVTIEGEPADEGFGIDLRLLVGDTLLAHDRYAVIAREVHRRVALSDPGIDDSRNELLWSPSSPRLIRAEISLVGRSGSVIDQVESYTALRSIAIEGDRFLLNGRPYPLRMVLDQGYWLETGLTAPDTEALRHDIELTKAMGFNGVRKHQKIEDPRYLHWADRLGLLVWEEMPSAYRFTAESVERATQEWMQVIERDASHPCIAAWVPINESWGVPNLPSIAAERNYVQALYHLTKTLDPTRPVVGNDGWESVATDIIGIHDYDPDPERIRRRYLADHLRPKLLTRERPAGRLLFLGSQPDPPAHPIVLSEFGGIAVASGESAKEGERRFWGYTLCATAEEFAERYAKLLEAVNSLDLIAGFCYTQFADTYQEANGLLRADRTPKFPIEQIAAATRGSR